MNLNWRELTVADVPLESLFSLLAEATEPVSLSALVLTLAKNELRRNAVTVIKPVPFDPKLSYSVGQSIQLPDGQVTHIARIGSGQNPVQGQFQILAFAETHLPRLVAGLTPTIATSISPSGPDETEIEEQARELLRSDAGSHLQRLVTHALQTDEHVVGFADEWWLIDKLSYTAGDDEINIVRDLLRERSSKARILSPIPVSDLAQLLWVVSPTDTAQLRLATFGLNCTLAQHPDFRCLRIGWVLAEQLPDHPVHKQPNVPRIRSKLFAELDKLAYEESQPDQTPPQPQLIRNTQDKSTQINSPDSNPWQDLNYWRQFLAWPVAKIRLLGQHYTEGFLPLGQQGLRRVIPPSQNELELAEFIFKRPDNTEGRFDVTIDYMRNIVVGGQPLHEYLASQGILPGCFLYIQHRSDTEYDIYPKLLSQPAQVKCKFASIENGELVTEEEVISIPYECEPKYIISETRLENMAALWREATDLNLSFFDILIRLFQKLAPHDEPIHWQKLWEAAFFGYRMGSQQAIQRELGRNCFVPTGDGYYRFEPERGYRFRGKEYPTKPPVITKVPSPKDDAPPLTWADLATLEIKYLFAGPSPLGRVLNYICRIKERTYSTILRGPRGPYNLDQWTVYAMVGLGLVKPVEETGKILQLTPAAETLYSRLFNFDEFFEGEDSAAVQQIKSQLLAQDVSFYQLLCHTFLNSPSLHTLLTYLRSLKFPLHLRNLYTQFAEFCPEMTKVTAEHRLPGLLRIAEFCEAIYWDAQGRLMLVASSKIPSDDLLPDVTPLSSPVEPILSDLPPV